MEKYKIFKLNNIDYNYLIIANTYENPINDFLAKGRVPKIEHGKVLFDLTLINGMKSNRFAVANVNDSKMEFSSIKPVSITNESVLKISERYFLENSKLVINSILPNSLKYAILNPKL